MNVQAPAQSVIGPVDQVSLHRRGDHLTTRRTQVDSVAKKAS
jgi:hypothetical protein